MTAGRRPRGRRRRDATWRRALDAARRGWGQTAPNPMVGAVVVRGERGRRRRLARASTARPHAEVMALAQAGDRARGATVYVTLEPCAHHGKTPPCADALIARRRRARRHRGARSEPDRARRRRAAARRRHRGRHRRATSARRSSSTRPSSSLRRRASLGDAQARALARRRDRRRRRRASSGSPARRRAPTVHELRAGSDAVAVGIGTALADDPLADRARRAAAARAAGARRLRPPGAAAARRARLVADGARGAGDRRRRRRRRVGAAPRWSARASRCSTRRLARGRARALCAGGGSRSLLVEGGPRSPAAFLERALVDRFIIFQAPVVLGAGALGAPSSARRPRTSARPAGCASSSGESFGDDLMTMYALRELPCSPD